MNNELIKRLKELKKAHISPYNLGDMGEIGSIIDKLNPESSAPEDGWIGVEEELPKKSGDYLTYETNHGIKVIGTMRFDAYNKQWFDDGDCFHPTHWQPLPKQPKTKSI